MMVEIEGKNFVAQAGVSDKRLGEVAILRREIRLLSKKIDDARKRHWWPTKTEHETELALKNQRREMQERLRELEKEEEENR